MKRYFYPIFILACWFFAANLNAQTLVASYSFSGSAKDLTTFANHASVNAAVLSQDRFGFPNAAFSFDGTQSFIKAGNAAQLNSASATISFWVNPTAFAAQGESYLISFGGYQERFKISLPSHGKPVFTTHSGGNCCSDLDSGTPLVLNTWTHVVMTHDGAKDIIYFDGVKVNEKATLGALDSTTKPLGFGFDPIDNNNFFNGKLDDIQFFDGAMTAAQVFSLTIAQAIAPQLPVGKVASYSFSGSGADAVSFANQADISTASLTTDRFGFGNSALLLDGASSEVQASNAIQLNSALTTISFWINPNEFAASGESYLLTFGGYQERFKISLPGHGKPVFTTHSGGNCCSDLDSGTPLALHTWTHVVMTHDGLNDIIYFNGVKVNEKAALGGLDITTKPLGIGFNAVDGGNYFNGAMDEIQIFNTALEGTQVASLFAAQSAFPGVSEQIVAKYSLNGDGSDDSQFQNDAEIDLVSAAKNRFGFAGNAASGALVADNSVALNSDFATISFWVNPTSLPASGEVYLLSNGGYQERWKISLPGHGKPVFTTHSGGNCCSDLDSGTPLAVSTWTHVVMTHDGAKDVIYFNGVKVNEKAALGALDDTKYPLGIGWDPIDGSGFFDGAMDDIEIHNKALTAAEVAVLFTLQSQTPVISGNLVANYTFDGDGDDETAYNNHSAGTTLGKDRFGKSNKSAAFNGVNSSATAANSPQLNSPFTTVSFWVKVKALPANSESFVLSFGGWQERWKISLPQHGKVVWTTNYSAGISDMDAGNGNELPIGIWKHVVMTHDGLTDKIYINGAKVAEKAVVGTLNNTTKDLGIGFNVIDGGNYFDGELDEIQIYKVALNESEIVALFISQNQPVPGGDLEAPDAPLNLTASVDFTNIQLSWFSASDNVGVVAYNVYQNGNLLGTTNDLGAFISDLAPLTEFTFGVSAVDAAGNESLLTTLKVTSGADATPDTTPPTAPGNVAGTAASNSVLVSWVASTDNASVAGYVISVDGVVFDTVSASTLSIFIGGLDPTTLYTFEIYAFDPSGNNSAVAEITLSTTPPIVTGEAGMVAHYPFDGNANDATPYNNHGVIGGNPTFEVPNHPNGGGQNIKFDGAQDSVLVPNGVQLISDYTTVSFWIRVDGTNPAVAESYIIDFGHWSERWKISLPQHLKIVWTTNSNNPQFANFISDMDSGDGNEMVKTFWWYVTMVHDGTNDIVYVNGIQTKIKPVMGKLNTTARPLCFGSNPIEGGQYFIGALDNVKIYNKALTPAEVAALFAKGTTATKDLVGNNLKNLILNVSPNPTVDLLTIQHAFSGNQPLLVRVFDAAGRQVDDLYFAKNEMPAGQFSLNVAQFVTGNYTLNFVLGGKDLGAIPFNKQ